VINTDAHFLLLKSYRISSRRRPKMDKKSLLFVGVSLLVVVVLITFGQSYGAPASKEKPTPAREGGVKEPYKIGVTMSLSGWSAGMGVNSKNALVMAMDEINQKGGVSGHKLTAVIYDNKSDDSTAVLNVKKLIESDKVDVLVVGSTTASCFASLDTVIRSKVPSFHLSASARLWRPTRPYIFVPVPSADLAERKRARLIKNLGCSKVGLLWVSGPYGEECISYFEKEANNFGLTIVANERCKGDDTDMSMQLMKIVAAKPEVITVTGYPHPGSIMAKNAKLLKINIPIIFCYATTSEAWIKLSAGAAEGCYGIVQRAQLGADLPPWDSTYPIVKAFAESYHKRFGESITSTATSTYLTVYVMAQGLKELGEEPVLVKRREKLASAVENLEHFFSLNGPHYFSPDNHNGLGEWTLCAVKIVDGKMSLVPE
jgi:branched-chain amino acid transport system substrate-binding protein